MLRKISTICLLSFVMFNGLAIAHPGRTDSSGGHTCRTNCASWGLSQGEYHYHNGGSKSSSSSSTSKSVDSRSEEEKKADGYIWQGEYYSGQKSYYNALYYYFKASELGYGWKVDGDKESATAKIVADQANQFYEKDELAKAKQYFNLLGQNSYYGSLYDVSAKIKLIESRQAFLDAFGGAIWYFKQLNYVNAVLLADKEMKNGLSQNKHGIEFMKEAALKLTHQAYNDFLKKDYEISLKRYNVLANSEYAPTDLKEGAVKNVKIVQKYIKD